MCSPDKPDRIWKEMANPYSALGISDSSDSDDELEMEAAAAAAAVDEAEEVWGDAFKAAEAIAAATLGARWVERHFTLDRTLKGTDHAASLEPDGVRRLKRDLDLLTESLTYKNKKILNCELNQRKKLKFKN